ncbi:signal peptidase I [Microbacterium memoriense]|uniref:Signal peptidase I n=1 Tax=Microbacterium memoriense TaxID=2978350 RepID=A0ABT2PAE9_9MICO|nr:signal peptidase I [Microbacterium memoriense]MCT9001561.1 signal peptidase I [Microbacterium memoriense]
MTSETTVTTGGARRESRRRGVWPLVRDILVILVVAVLVSFLIKTFLVRSFYIPSGSMEQTLQVKDRILVDELTPRFGGYDRGDIVVFRDPGGWLPVESVPEQSLPVQAVDWLLSVVGISAPDSKDHLIKRIIGVGGDHVVCCNPLGQITVDGTPIDETPYLDLADGQTAPEVVSFDVTVPEGSLWVLGDNRDHSRDSRYNVDQPSQGFVPIDNVVGRAFLITWPLPRFGALDFHHDVFDGIPDAR